MDGDTLQIGSMAPDFTLQDQEGKLRTLSDCRGSWVFLCFYPSDDIGRCTLEVCTLRDRFPEFQKFGVAVFAISTDSPANHKKFAVAHRLQFPLLTDAHRKVAHLYDAITREQFSNSLEEITQTSFLINTIGEIEKIYSHARPQTHAAEALAHIAKLHNEEGGEIML
jgi:peroxiredoxin Q/BCP